MRQELPIKNALVGEEVNNYLLEREVGRGKTGVVYLGTEQIQDIKRRVAVKLIPSASLKVGWETELKKCSLLENCPQVIRYYETYRSTLQGIEYVCIISEFVDGLNLNQYIQRKKAEVSLPFVKHLIEQLLEMFHYMAGLKLTHDDLHGGNIMIAHDPLRIDASIPVIKVGDFGIGGSNNMLEPKDDYFQLASICRKVIEACLPDRFNVPTEERNQYDYIVGDFLPKIVLERNSTVGSFVRVPGELHKLFTSRTEELRKASAAPPTVTLQHPFDYLSGEQIGDSFELLQKLYSRNFPGYASLLERSNTLFTGPRGCGKTTIFRNLSLRTQLLAGKTSQDENERFVGVYYHCQDLFFTFHYAKRFTKKLPLRDARLLTHYFNLVIGQEILETIRLVGITSPGQITDHALRTLESFIGKWFENYSSPPLGTELIDHLIAYFERKRSSLSQVLRSRYAAPSRLPKTLLPPNWLPELCSVLQQQIGWFKNKPFYIFLDDYSSPRVFESVQRTLNDTIMSRWSSCFFKVSTESITTFYPRDSAGKLTEPTREYDVVDLAVSFLHKPFTSGKKASEEASLLRRSFLVEIIDNRLKHATSIHSDYKSIEQVLGMSQYRSYNALARAIRNANEGVHYAGINTITDLFSGDIADILRLIRGIFDSIPDYKKFSKPGIALPISPESQDRAIRHYASSFLERVAAAPERGEELRKIAEAFGNTANWYLKNRDSKNQNTSPPKQAFRIEIRQRPSFEDLGRIESYFSTLEPEDQKRFQTPMLLRSYMFNIYRDLLKYGVFLRDIRGKSLRGAVVPRLYLRRLLIPTFLLTPNQRDSIGMEVEEFFVLLVRPDKFLKLMSTKPDRKATNQETLDL